jgi:tRNA pseudouridine38-40 synthase
VRYFLDISYNGTAYHGWQIQNNAHTVQAEIENALSKLLGVPTAIMGSGRTDTGVHAIQQIAHFDTENAASEKELRYKLNSFLSPDISINQVLQVHPEAHARFDATERSYQYFIHQEKTPFRQGMSYYFSRELNILLMNQAAEKLLGTKDFESFSKVKTEVNNFICTITEARWKFENESLIFHVSANRFLRGMVRALVGTLLEVGLGKINVEDFAEILVQKDRTAAGRSVPPQGLFLSEVKYPESVYII